MGRYFSGSPYRDYDRWEADQNAWLNARPKCAWCGKHIQEEHAYRIGDDLVCEDCIESEKVNVDDLIEQQKWQEDDRW